MGNYFASLPYINSRYQPENNNLMATEIAVHVDEPRVPKITNYLNVVDASTVLAVNALQNEYKKDSSVIMKLWNRLYNFNTTPFAPCATHLIEESSRTISLEENSQLNSVKSKREGCWKNEREAESDCFISFRFNSKRSPKDCLKYTPPDTINVSQENSSVKTTCERSWKNGFEALSDDINNFRLNSKGYQRPQAQDYIKGSQNRPLSNFIFQRLDSGIEDPPYPCKTRTQIDLDSSYFTRVIRMADNQESCLLSGDLMFGTGTTQGYHKSISFFIDIRDPLKQKPLGEEYKFSACSECDSMFSDKCSESYLEDYLEGDFIVFEESSSDEEDGSYGFNFIPRNTCTPVGLSCSVSANSTVKTCFDISMDTSLYANKNPRKPSKESTVSVKIGIRRGGNDKTQHESSILRNNSCNASGCADLMDFSTNEVDSELAYISRLKTSITSFDVCTINEKKPTIFPNSNSSSAGGDECTLSNPNCTSEMTSKMNSSKSKTSAFVVCTTKKKKSQKKVCFEKDEDLVVVHQMRHWDFAYRDARKGTWELTAVDRCRFWRRIKELEFILSPCLRRKLEVIQNT